MAEKWRIFWMLFASYVFCVYYRKLFSHLLPFIVDEVKLTNDEIGWIASTHYVAYAIGKLFFGVASDLINPTVTVTLGLVGIILSVQIMAVSTTLWHFALSSAINGFLQGSGWPGIIKIIRQIFSTSEFARAFTVMACTNNVAGFIGPFTLILPWRQTSCLTATIGLGFASWLWIVLRQTQIANETDHCSNHQPLQNDPLTNKSKMQQHSFSWWSVAKNEVIWLIALFYSLTMTSRAIAETWIPLFVSEQSSQTQAVRTSFFFETGGFFGSVVSGVVIELLYRYMSRDHSRLFSAIIFTSGMLFALGALFRDISVLFSAFMLGFSIYACINIWGLVSSDMADVTISGRCTAFFTFVSNLFAMVAGAPLAWLVSFYGYSILSVLSFPLIFGSLTVCISYWNTPLHIHLHNAF